MESLCNLVNEDKTTELPEPILHQILSLLSTKDANKTCVLSKTWNPAWNSFPVLDFNQNYFHNFVQFYNYVNNTIARRGRGGHNTHIQKFNLRVYTKSHWEGLDRWLNYAASNNVEHFVLHNLKLGPSVYKLPASALCHPKSLKELDLLGFKIDIDCNFIGLFFSLKTLRLEDVYVDDHTLQILLSNSSCPSLEEVSIVYCNGFQSLSLCNAKLKSVELYLDRFQVQKITIEAPNLRFLSLRGECASDILSRSRFEATQYIKNLKELVLHDADITKVVLLAIREFGVLEKLKLINCHLLEGICISRCRRSNLDVSDTTICLRDDELVADCLDCCLRRHSQLLFSNGFYKLLF